MLLPKIKSRFNVPKSVKFIISQEVQNVCHRCTQFCDTACFPRLSMDLTIVLRNGTFCSFRNSRISRFFSCFLFVSRDVSVLV